MSLPVKDLAAWEILDSRGRPTICVEATLANGVSATAHAPSGASTGSHEAVESRDGDEMRYGGFGVRKAVRNVETTLAQAVRGMDAGNLEAIDRRMLEIDGTDDRSGLGANAILGVSCALARALSVAEGAPLWKTLGAQFPGAAPLIPVPMVNIFSGGRHAHRSIEFQDFLVVPHGFGSLAESLEAAVCVHERARRQLEIRGIQLTGVADEGGWGPRLSSNETALQLLTEAIHLCGYRPAEQCSIAIDVAASQFFRTGSYHIETEGRILSGEEMIEQVRLWTRKYPLLSVEDALDQDDWQAWRELTLELGNTLQIVGDDLFTTNPERVRRGIEEKSANAVLVKMNQIGTLTETFEVLKLARENGLRAIVSARSGETEDSFLADLAVASGAGQIKVGSIHRSERLSKYNRLLEIEKRHRVPYATLR